MDLEKFQIPNKSLRISTKRITKKFLKGPILLDWLKGAARLPGRTLQVGVILHYLSGVMRSTEVKFSYLLAEEFGVKRHAAYRALKALENEGLIKVQRGVGKCPIVQLIEISE